ncbi:MAG TPA: PQQ-binding-like beta-propeller repeat protein, partial [Caulifigura sp.]|nr:PQQ-binding-like beta-propeller repeat protein [Caulifigura sp.]
WLGAWKPREVKSQGPEWRLAQGRVIRLGAESDFEAGHAVRIEGRPALWMADRRFEYSSGWVGLSMIDRRSGRPEWAMPLSSNGVVFDEATLEATVDGSIVAVCSRGMLQVCSPGDRRLLWSWPLPARFAATSAYQWAEEHLSNPPAQTSAVAVNDFQLNVGNLRIGSLMAIAGERLALLGQHELVVFDLRTGEEQWRRGGIAASSVIVADEQRICVSATANGGPAAFRLVDGKRLESASMQGVFARAFAAEGDRLLTRQGLPRLLSSGVRLVAERPFNGESVWSHAVNAEAVIRRLPGRELGVVEPTGDVFVIDIETGRRTNVGRLAQEQMTGRRAIHLLSDAERVYVVVQRQQAYEFSNISIPSITINGELAAFDRKQGRMIWRERVRGLSLLTSGLADSPVVMLVEHGVPERRRKALDLLHLPELKLTALDKATGAHVVEWSGTTPHGAPGAMLIDPLRQRIDLLLTTYNQNASERLRLQFGASSPTSVP